MYSKHIILFLCITFTLALGKDYKGAELRTIDSFLYGRFEVNYKPAKGTGILSNFFTYNDFEECCNEWNEIDIEILGRYDDDVQTTTITPRQTIYNSHSKVDFSPHDDYHTYAFEWTPDYVAWFVNGEEVYRQTGEHISTLSLPQKLMMNIWSAEWEPWVGVWNPEILPVFAWYDWVAYYGYTPGEGDAGSDNNFTLQWRDDFNEWDQERWEKATHTWPGNRVDMAPDNIIFKDGYMILAITDEGATGYFDNKPPTLLWARGEDSTITIAFSETVDSISAVQTGNYVVTGATIKSVQLHADKRGATLHTSILDKETSYSVVIFGISDDSEQANTQNYDFVTLIHSRPVTFPLQVNIGGPAVYDGAWLADQLWGPNSEFGHMDGYNQNYSDVDILNTTIDSVYLHALDEVVRYRVRVPNGLYNVELGFAENEYQESGVRLFGVSLEDYTLVEGLDLVAEAGAHTAYTLRAHNVAVWDGILDIHFNNWTDKPLFSSLRVELASLSAPSEELKSPRSLKLLGNYPNPFNPQTRIHFSLPTAARVILQVYDATGRKVFESNPKNMWAGEHSFLYRAGNNASGVYYYRISALSNGLLLHDVGKMVLIK